MATAIIDEDLWAEALNVLGRDRPRRRYRVTFRRYVTNLDKVRVYDYYQDALRFVRLVREAGGQAADPKPIMD